MQEVTTDGSLSGARPAHHESAVVAPGNRIADRRFAGKGGHFENTGQGGS